MPIELRKANQQNDRAVMEASGMPIRGTTEASCVAELMRRYQAVSYTHLPGIRFGLGGVKNVGHGAVELIEKERAHGAFASIFDLSLIHI